MNNLRRPLGIVAAAGALVASLLAAAPASATSSQIEEIETADGPYTVLSAPSFEPETVETLQEHGLIGDVRELQYDETGVFVTFIGDESSFVTAFQNGQQPVLPESLAQNDESISAESIVATAAEALREASVEVEQSETGDIGIQADWEWGICFGSFAGSRKVNSTIEWGGTSTCEGTPNAVYPHKLTVDLYSTCTDWWCAINGHEATGLSPASSDYSRVASVARASICSGSHTHIFEQRAIITAGGVERGRAWQRDVTLACSDLIH